jgi:hypothetical protein
MDEERRIKESGRKEGKGDKVQRVDEKRIE